MAPTRRPATPTPAGVDFGSMHSPIYSGSFVLPEGDYALFFETKMQQPKGGTNYKARLGVMVLAYPLDKPGVEPVEQFLSMGSKAAESFQPSENGKGLTLVVGGPGTLPTSSNWNLFRDSLYNSRLPVGIFSDSLETLDGIWVHTTQVPEPEDRKSFASSQATSEVEQPKRQGSSKIPVVTEILDGGKPWEGGGGIPEAAPAAALKAGPWAVAPKVAPARPVPARQAAAASAGDEDTKDVAVNAIVGVLTDAKYANGCPKLILKTSVFKAIEASNGKEMAQAVASEFFPNGNDAPLSDLLDEIDYQLAGTTVKAKA